MNSDCFLLGPCYTVDYAQQVLLWFVHKSVYSRSSITAIIVFSYVKQQKRVSKRVKLVTLKIMLGYFKRL